MNPCAEILLPNKGFCNLVSIDVLKFKNDTLGLLRAAKIVARANYRQTVVDFRDGILQEAWHLNNEHLRLCGVSVMGVAGRPDMKAYEYRRLERVVTTAAYDMAKELGLPYPKNITALKPEGTQSKCYDSLEGMHKPLGKYILNNVAFSKYDPLVEKLRSANYNVFNHPYDDSAALITFPVKNEGVEFDIVDGKEVNLDSAIKQLEVYKMLMDNYCQQNVSCTISYSVDETKEIVDWLYNNWDSYVAVSFLFRNDPSKTAKDLGYPYLPQEVTTKEIYEEYIRQLLPVSIDEANSFDDLLDQDCATGACPIR
jgi:ribonucleoside-triphosphate reductase